MHDYDDVQMQRGGLKKREFILSDVFAADAVVDTKALSLNGKTSNQNQNLHQL